MNTRAVQIVKEGPSSSNLWIFWSRKIAWIKKINELKLSSIDLSNCILRKIYEANRDFLVLKLQYISEKNHTSYNHIIVFVRLFVEQRLKQIKSNTFNNSNSVPFFEKEMHLRNNTIKTKKHTGSRHKRGPFWSRYKHNLVFIARQRHKYCILNQIKAKEKKSIKEFTSILGAVEISIKLRFLYFLQISWK